MKLNKNAKGIIYKKGEFEFAVAVDKNNPGDNLEFYVKTKLKRLPTAEELVNEN